MPSIDYKTVLEALLPHGSLWQPAVALTTETLGAELVTNGTFDSDISGWNDNSTGTGAIAWNPGGYMDLSRGGAPGEGRADQQLGATGGGLEYQLTFDVLIGSAGGGSVEIGTTEGADDILNVTITTPGSYSVLFTAAGAITWIGLEHDAPETNVSIDNVSVKQKSSVVTTEGGLDQLLQGIAANHTEVWNFLTSLTYIRDPRRTPVLDDLEREFGIYPNPALTDTERREKLAATKYARVGTGSKDQLQNALINAGFTDELINNGHFKKDIIGWTTSGAVSWLSPGYIKLANQNSFADQPITTEIGKVYTLKWQIIAPSVGTIKAGTTQGASDLLSVSWTEKGNKVAQFTATSTTSWIRLQGVSGAITVLDNISLTTNPSLLVWENSPAQDPNIFFISSLMQCGEALAQCGEPAAQCQFFTGELIVNGDIFNFTIDYTIECGESLAQCGEPAATAGEMSGVTRTKIEYPIPTDPDAWPFIFFVGGKATFNPDYGETITGEEILIDGDMETAGVGDWTAGRDAVLTKSVVAPHGGVRNLRVAHNGTDDPFAEQNIFDYQNSNSVFTEIFKTQTNVELNGGIVSGTPTIEDGVTLNGSTDYITYALYGDEFDNANISIVIEFYPGFDHDANIEAAFFSTGTANEYTIYKRNNAGSNELGIILNGTVIAFITEATYSPYWHVGERNILVLSGTTGDTNVWLNGNKILSNDNTAWSEFASTSIDIGRRTNGTRYFDGIIKEFRVFQELLTQTDVNAYMVGLPEKRYWVRGWAKGDGAAVPAISSTTLIFWEGTSVAAWQPFDLIIDPESDNIRFIAQTAVAGFCEFDDVSIKEVFIPAGGAAVYCGDTLAQCGEPGALCQWFQGELAAIDFVDVPYSRRADLKRLILQIKPIHSWCMLLVNFT